MIKEVRFVSVNTGDNRDLLYVDNVAYIYIKYVLREFEVSSSENGKKKKILHNRF